MKFLRKQNPRSLPSAGLDFPPGTFIETEKGYFFVVNSAKRYRFLSLRVLESWRPARVVKASEADARVKKLKVFGRMKFRDGSLLYSQASGKMYLVSEKKLRHITSPDILTLIGADRLDAVWVSSDEIKLHEMGEPLG